MRKNILMLLLPILILHSSCDSKEQKLKNEFVDKIWVIEEATMKEFNHQSVAPQYILKPEKDSTFGIYKDQYILFENFKIKEDTLFLKSTYFGPREEGGSEFIYIPYKFIKTGKYSATLFACDTVNINFSNFYKFSLTDLTDLFKGQPDNSESKLYLRIKEFVWYPTEVAHWTQTILNEENPKYYIKENVFSINDSNKINFLNGVAPIYGTSSSVYKFIDELNPKTKSGSIDVATAMRFYQYDTLRQELVDMYVVSDMSNNRMELFNNNTPKISMKKIDPTILVDMKDVPKGFRFQCTMEKAKMLLKENLEKQNDSRFYFDFKSIKLFQENSDNCEYTFLITQRSRTYYDVYKTHKVSVYITDDGDYMMRFL